MKSILEEIWYGNMSPKIECCKSTQPANELIQCITDQHDELMATLTDEQKAKLEKFDDCYAALTDINEREIFVYAFRFGARVVWRF